MIKAIGVYNFKSLAKFQLDLSHFTCLIGMNGTGKSTILQLFDFISQLMHGDIEEWLLEKGWKPSDLACKLPNNKKRSISLGIIYKTNNNKELHWKALYNPTEMRCTKEVIEIDGEEVFKLEKQHTTTIKKNEGPVNYDYQGSIFSRRKEKNDPPEISEFRNAIRNIGSPELLSPQLLRQRTHSQNTGIGTGINNLPTRISNLSAPQKLNLTNSIKKLYPSISDISVTSMRSGWKKLSATEIYDESTIETEATHLNDGVLRVLGILLEYSQQDATILLDEVENGINPEIMELLVNQLVQAPQQTLVTTHSPMILNYLDDDTARESVQFVYKGPDGSTRVRRFFEIERINRKLDVMGPGEAFVDTDLRALTQECIQLDAQDEQEEQQHKVTKDSTA